MYQGAEGERNMMTRARRVTGQTAACIGGALNPAAGPPRYPGCSRGRGRRPAAAGPQLAPVSTLLSERGPDGTIDSHPYRAKWYGAHWVLVTLAELGYPSGDLSLLPQREQMLGWLFTRDYLDSLGRGARAATVARLHRGQRAVGHADTRHRRRAGRAAPAGAAARRRVELRPQGQRQELLVSGIAHSAARNGDGSVIHPSFLELHYPCYWHHDFLFSLLVMAESGRLGDERYGEALASLGTKRRPDGGLPLEHRYYRWPEPWRRARARR